MRSIIQVYQDIGRLHLVFAQIMETPSLEFRRSEGLDDILEGSERVYSSELPFAELRREFFNKIVKPNTQYRVGESHHLMGEKTPYGTCFPFKNSFYDQLNLEIQEKLTLEENN